MGRLNKLFKRGDTWYADLRSIGLGKPSLRTSDQVVAKARLRDYELGTTGQAPHPPKALDEAIDEMAALKRSPTKEFYLEKGSMVVRILGDKTDINSLTAADIANYATTRLAEGASRHTIHKELTCLRQALKSAAIREQFFGNIKIVPAWKADYEPAERWLTQAEFKRLLEAVPYRRQTWLMVQLYTGSELGVMKRLASMPRGGWEHVDLKRAKITLPGTKRSSRYRANLPIHPTLLAWLKKCDPDAPLVAPWPKVHRDFKLACVKAKIVPPATTHDLRRTFGSWLVQEGVDLHHVARLMGNTYNMVARVYGQTSDASYEAAISKLPKLKTTRRTK